MSYAPLYDNESVAFLQHQSECSCEVYDSDNLRIQFIFSGLTAVLGSREVRQAPQFMAVLAQTDIGRAAIDTLRKIAASQH